MQKFAPETLIRAMRQTPRRAREVDVIDVVPVRLRAQEIGLRGQTLALGGGLHHVVGRRERIILIQS